MKTIHQGIKGGNKKTIQSGYCAIIMSELFTPESAIRVDASKGEGKTYQKRDEPLINIVANDETIFNGTFTKLTELLTTKKNQP